MLNNITIGQYFPGNSVLHRLDPRSKIAILFFLIVAIFVFDQPVAYGVLTLLTFACMVASGVPMKTQVGAVDVDGVHGLRHCAGVQDGLGRAYARGRDEQS